MRLPDVQLTERYHVAHHVHPGPWRAEQIVETGHARGHGRRTRQVRLVPLDRQDGHRLDAYGPTDVPARDLTPWNEWWQLNGVHQLNRENAAEVAGRLTKALADAGIEVKHLAHAADRVAVRLTGEQADKLVALLDWANADR